MANTTWYRTGTVTVTSGAKAVAGTGTNWLSQVMGGDLFFIVDGSGQVTAGPFEIESVSADTALTIKSAWPNASASGSAYAIVRNFTGTLSSDLAAKVAKVLNQAQLGWDEFVTLMTSSGQVTLTTLTGETITTAGLLGYSDAVPNHNAADDAHGMTAPGRTLMRAASHAGQRSALELVNHEKVSVDSDGRARAAEFESRRTASGNMAGGGVGQQFSDPVNNNYSRTELGTDGLLRTFVNVGSSAWVLVSTQVPGEFRVHGVARAFGEVEHSCSLNLQSVHNLDKGIRAYTNATAPGVYNGQVQTGDQFIVNNVAGGGGLVVGQHDGASWRMDANWITANRRVTVSAAGQYGTIRVTAPTGYSERESSIGFYDGDTSSISNNIWTLGYRSGGVDGFALYSNPLGRNVLHISPSAITTLTGQLKVRDEITPVFDNNHAIGLANLRFSTAYFATNPVIGSDSRLKTDIAEIPGAIAADIMQSLRPVTFRYRVGGQEAYQEDEDYEEQAQVTESVEVPKTTVQIVDGKAVQVTTTETVQQPVYDEYPLVDGDGKPVMQLVAPAVLDEESGEEVYVRAVHREPRTTTITKTRKVTKYREVEGRRYHAGYIAQEVKAALDAVADRWPPAADLAVWLLSDTADADSTQMVRMEQMTPILHAAMRYQLAAA